VIQRIAVPHGALLAARDLGDADAAAAATRALHVHLVHDTWGVALGMGVARSADGAALMVGAGLAYDRRGREVVLAGERRMDVPPPPGPGDWWLDLLAAAPATLRWSVAGPAGPGRRPQLGADVRRGEEIPLARLRVGPAGALGVPDTALRPAVQRLATPRVGAGRVAQGSRVDGTRAAWRLRVSTAAAGFLVTPRYFATLAGHPLGKAAGTALGPFTRISSPGPAGFDLEVRLAGDPGLIASLAGAQRTSPVPVDWLGVAPPEGCPPDATPT
jgi:hypothetical protein